jgi:hypothetical protein
MSATEWRGPSEDGMGNGTLFDAHFSRLQAAAIALIRIGIATSHILRASSFTQEVTMLERAKSVELPKTA